MLKQCVVCDTWFDARGSAKCCSPECKRERERERERERNRERYHNDPVYRERQREWQRERKREWMKDPEYRERERERERERYGKKQLDKKFKTLQTGIEQFLKEKKGKNKMAKQAEIDYNNAYNAALNDALSLIDSFIFDIEMSQISSKQATAMSSRFRELQTEIRDKKKVITFNKQSTERKA
jgi:hypothetical protein